MKNKILPVLFALFALFTANQASAYYSPSTGRWLSRDPMGEPGFELLRAASMVPRVVQDVSTASLPPSRLLVRDPIGEPGGLNLYGFVANDSVNKIDLLGLLKFDGCSADQQKQIEQQLKDYLNKVDSSGFRNCMCKNTTIPDRLKALANDPGLVVKCEASKTGSCANSCGWSYTGGSTIHLCPQGLDSGSCGPIGCTLYHEMTHMIGHPGEKWPDAVEKCLGCQ